MGLEPIPAGTLGETVEQLDRTEVYNRALILISCRILTHTDLLAPGWTVKKTSELFIINVKFTEHKSQWHTRVQRVYYTSSIEFNLPLIKVEILNIIEKPNSSLIQLTPGDCGEKKTPLLTERNLWQTQTQCGRPSASTSWVLNMQIGMPRVRISLKSIWGRGRDKAGFQGSGCGSGGTGK